MDKIQTQSQFSEGEETSFKEQNQQILAWIESIKGGKTAKANSHNQNALQHQIQVLSQSYKNAQAKLLNLEQQLYHESIHSEKQRGVIEILKYIINENLDDETILAYLANLEEESANNHSRKQEIKADLEEIKSMVARKKAQCKKHESLKAGALSDLKKQLKVCQKVKRELMEDLDNVLNEKGQLEASLEHLRNQLNGEKQIINELKNRNIQLEEKVSNLESRKNKVEEQNEEQKISNNILQQNRVQLVSKIQELLNCDQTEKRTIDSEKQCEGIQLMNKLANKLQKYRSYAKQTQTKLEKFSKREHLITVLKLFIPEEALGLFEEYEAASQTQARSCLMEELSQLARLEKKKNHQLQSCQEQMWRMRIRNIRDEESANHLRLHSVFSTKAASNSRTHTPSKLQAHKQKVPAVQAFEEDKENADYNIGPYILKTDGKTENKPIQNQFQYKIK